MESSMKQKKPNHFLRKYWWEITIIILSSLGFVLGIVGFSKLDEEFSFTGKLYETFRLFLLNYQFDLEMNMALEVARWFIFIVFLLIAMQLFIKILEPFQNIKIQHYKNHIVICGLNALCIELIHKFSTEKIVVIASENNQYTESLKQRKIKLIIGDPTDDYILKTVRIDNASRVYAITDNDRKNVEIAQSVFSVVENKNRKEALKCFTLLRDCELKLILEESSLFKYKVHSFDGILFNINEMGIKYGVAMNIDKILPEKIENVPEILLVGLTEKTEMLLSNLAHCLTMQRETFNFLVAENDTDKISLFEKQCKKLHLKDFAEIKTMDNNLEIICAEKTFHSIIVCTENRIDAIKQAVEIHYLLGKNAPNILLFCEDVDIFNKALKEELEMKKIFPINLFGQIADYIFELDKNIEEKAKETHHFWNILYNQNLEWDQTTGHYKQSSRNQILDNYLRIFIARGKKFEDFKNRLVSFSDHEKETLAMMEHRRWMLEKFENGWTLGERDNENKRHNCLISWEELSSEQKAKDYDAIDLMIKLLTNQ